MKKLWIVRHAKSSWDDFSLADHDRPLNKRGKRDAPFMGQFISDNYEVPQQLITSTANRALTTCRAFQKAMALSDDCVLQLEELYHASLVNCFNAIHKADEANDVIAIFGHNPTFTYLIQELTNEGPDNHPTCGCALVTSESETWANFEDEKCELSRYFFPKQFFKHD